MDSAQSLAFERVRLEQEMLSLADQHAMQWARAAHLVVQAKRITKDTNKLLLTIPSSSSSSYCSKPNTHHNILAQYAHIKDILEIPHLIANCIRAGQTAYDDAIDLYWHTKLHIKPHINNTLLANIDKQLDVAAQKLTDTRLKDIESEKMHLTTLVKAIGHLRRLAVFSEQQLAQQFLVRREKFIKKEIGQIQAQEQNSYLFIARVLDFYRIQIFEVVAQYNAIFVTNDAKSAEMGNPGNNGLEIWISLRIEDLLKMIESELAKIIDCSIFTNLIKQAISCSQTLANVGVQFLGLFMNLVNERIMKIYEDNLQVAFEAAFNAFEKYQPSVSEEDLLRLGVIESVGASKLDFLIYPCIAVLLNGLNNAVFSLSMCAPINLCEAAILMTNLKLENFAKDFAEKISKNEKFSSDAEKICEVLSSNLIPKVLLDLYQIFDVPLNSVLRKSDTK